MSLKHNLYTQKLRLILVLLILSTICVSVYPSDWDANEPGDFFDMSLEELMDVEVGVASRKKSTQRESPGIVTVITRDQIQKSGARDLVDILRQVPGFNVGFDTVGAYGVAIRGIWANEGKVLVLMDGVELNDDMYSTFQYGHHIPVDIIDKIEIMRGPGSAMYGESAELGVINITTISPQKKDDIQVSTTYSRTSKTFAGKGVTGFYGTKEEDISFSVISHYEQGNFTDKTAVNYDLVGSSVDLDENDNSEVISPFFNIGLNWGNFSLRTIIDRYGLNSPWPGYSMYKMSFYSDIIETKYRWPVTDSLAVTSRFIYKHQKPWNYPSVTYSGGSFENRITSDKYTSEVFFSYDIAGGHNIVGGIAYDEITGGDNTHTGLLEDGQNKVSYYNASFYGEGFFKTPYGNLTIGGRQVKHNHSGSSFVPRLALTKAIGDYHVKAIFSKAYRNPSIMNIAYNPNIKPEETTIYELEAGKQVSDNLLLTASVFDIEISDPIVYFYSGTSNYVNFNKTGSRGVEFSGIYKKDTTNISLIYSFYNATDNEVSEYSVPGDGDSLLGFPSHKLSLYTSVSPCKNLFITPSLTYFSSRYAVTDYGTDYIYDKLDSKILTNVSLLFKDAFQKERLDMSFAIYNIFDEDYDFIEPYLGGYAPIPGPSRVFAASLMYRF